MMAAVELERSRGFAALVRTATPAPRVMDASYTIGGETPEPEQLRVEMEWFRAELEYRQAYAQMRSVMRGDGE